MKMMKTILGAMALSIGLSATAFAEPPTTSSGSTGAMAEQKPMRATESKKESAPAERAAFRWEGSAERIQKTQEALNKNGANLKVDGVLGETTRDELRRYQRNNKLTETGRIDDATAKSLGVESK